MIFTFARFALLFISGILMLSFCDAQVLPQKKIPRKPLRYTFVAGDSLVYRIESNDSIAFEEKPVLLRIRTEYVSIVCDSVNSKGLMYLRYTLQDYKSKQIQGENQEAFTTVTPWVKRSIAIIIDEHGFRHPNSSIPNSIQSALSPGGAFQPSILLCYGDTAIKKVGTSHLIVRTDSLVENGYPAPIISSTVVFDTKNTYDTLGTLCTRYVTAVTGRGSFYMADEKNGVYTTTALFGTAIFHYSRTQNCIVSMIAKWQNKVQVSTKNSPSSHRGVVETTSDFTLLSKTNIYKKNSDFDYIFRPLIITNKKTKNIRQIKKSK